MENVNHQVLDLVPQKHSQIVDPTGGCFTRSIKHQRLPGKVEEVKEGGAGDVSLSPQRCRELQPGADGGFAHRTQHTTHPTDADSVLYSESCVCCVVLTQRCRWTSGLQSSRSTVAGAAPWKKMEAAAQRYREEPTDCHSVSVYNITISPAERQYNNCLTASSYRNKVFIAHCCWILLHCAES